LRSKIFTRQNPTLPPTSTTTNKKEDGEQLESLRTREEYGQPAEGEDSLLKSFRTVEEKAPPEAAAADMKISETLAKHGVNLNYQKEPVLSKCKENEIYLMNKQKMFLVSSEKIVHDISGLAQYEDNLVSQIKSQDKLIKTLKARLEVSEKQDKNLGKILSSLKINEKTRLLELEETKKLLDESLQRRKDLEEKNLEQIKEVQNANKYSEELKLLLHEKDIIINDLRGKMNLSEEAEKNKYLEEKLETCEKEKDAVSKANKILEANYKILNSANIALNFSSQYQSEESVSELTIIKKELSEQDNLIVLLKTEIGSYKKEMQDLNTMLLGKDSVVRGLQEQIGSFLERDFNSVQMCQDKDLMIDSQSSLVSGLRNMTALQDRLGKAKDAALKILQKTVYEMVEKISQCRDPLVAGLRAEIKALQDKQDPLEKIVERMHGSLEAFKSILSYKQTNDETGKLNQIAREQSKALDLCRQETARQNDELNMKFESRNRDLQITDNADSQAKKCEKICDKNARFTRSGAGESKQ